MAALDEITKEKERISEALARVDAQRERLSDQLKELEATERVLARYSKGMPAKRRAADTATKAAGAVPSGRRGRTTAAKPAGTDRSSPSLGDQILALATGKMQQEIAAACKGVRANHVGIAIARHRRGSNRGARWEALRDAPDRNRAARRSLIRRKSVAPRQGAEGQPG